MTTDELLKEAFREINATMTVLTSLRSRIEPLLDTAEPTVEDSKPIRDIDFVIDNHQDIISEGEQLDELIKAHSLDPDELNKEFPSEQYTDGHVLEVMKERLDKPEEGKIYSLHKLSETKEWSKSEVIEDVQLHDVEMTEVDLDDLFNGL